MTAPLTYSVDEAAERLGYIVNAGWLKKHIGELPHLKAGSGTGRSGRVAFTEAHLAEILVMLEKRPESTPSADPDDWGVRTRRTA